MDKDKLRKEVSNLIINDFIDDLNYYIDTVKATKPKTQQMIAEWYNNPQLLYGEVKKPEYLGYTA